MVKKRELFGESAFEYSDSGYGSVNKVAARVLHELAYDLATGERGIPVALQLDYRFGITDLELEEEEVEVTATFIGQ